MYAGAITCCDVIQNKNQLFWKRRRERFMRSWRSQSPCSRHVRLGSHSRASTGRKTVGVCPRWVSRLGELRWFKYEAISSSWAGMPLAQAVEILKKQCAIIKNVQLKYSEQVCWTWVLDLVWISCCYLNLFYIASVPSWHGCGDWHDRRWYQAAVWPQEPKTQGIELSLHDFTCLQLVLNPTQMIEVYDVKKVRLKYWWVDILYCGYCQSCETDMAGLWVRSPYL